MGSDQSASCSRMASRQEDRGGGETCSRSPAGRRARGGRCARADRGVAPRPLRPRSPRHLRRSGRPVQCRVAPPAPQRDPPRLDRPIVDGEDGAPSLTVRLERVRPTRSRAARPRRNHPADRSASGGERDHRRRHDQHPPLRGREQPSPRSLALRLLRGRSSASASLRRVGVLSRCTAASRQSESFCAALSAPLREFGASAPAQLADAARHDSADLTSRARSRSTPRPLVLRAPPGSRARRRSRQALLEAGVASLIAWLLRLNCFGLDHDAEAVAATVHPLAAFPPLCLRGNIKVG